MQDSSINYDLKIVCFNNLQWVGNGFIIPSGPLREKIGSIKFYDAVVINGDPNFNKDLIDEVKKINKNLKIFQSEYKVSNLDDFDKKLNYTIFSAIGNPANFINILKKNDFNISKEFIFPDHYNFSDKDLEKIIDYSKKNNLKIITTEKDFCKIDEKFSNQIFLFEARSANI